MRYVSNMTKVEVHKGQAMPWLEETTNFESDTIDSDKGWCYLCYQLALTMNCGIINTKNSAEISKTGVFTSDEAVHWALLSTKVFVAKR